MKQVWEGAQGDLSSVSVGVQVLYPNALLYKILWEFAQAIAALSDAGENEQCSPHTIYLALLVLYTAKSMWRSE